MDGGRTMSRVGIIGAGRGGSAYLEILRRDPGVQVVGIADIDQNAPGILLAKRLSIPVYRRFETLLGKGLDVVIDVTNSNTVEHYLRTRPVEGVQLISGGGAKFAWDLVAEKVERQEEAERLLIEYRTLYELGLKLASTDHLDKLFGLVVESATRLTHTPAGSLSIFDEEQGEMVLVASAGFSKRFSKVRRWKVRKGGLTSHILNQKGPLIVANMKAHSQFNSQTIRQEGIQALGAVTLSAEGKIIGILCVNDFQPRRFTPREVSLLSLLSTIAAITILKTNMLENTRLLAITDELTGLFNHRHFVESLQSELSRARRYRQPLSLIMVDIDNFKQYNDLNGHLRGNDVLRKVGELIRRSTREVDVPARYGGEEFAVIMPVTDRKRARILAERLRIAIAKFPFPHRETQPGGSVTVSIGVASSPPDAFQPHLLVEKADQALYEAKARGRNRVCMARPEQNAPASTQRRAGRSKRAAAGSVKSLRVTFPKAARQK